MSDNLATTDTPPTQRRTSNRNHQGTLLTIRENAARMEHAGLVNAAATAYALADRTAANRAAA